MYSKDMSSCIKQIYSVRTKVVVLCVVLVFAMASCASQSSGSSSAVNYELAKVYLVEQGPTPGQSGDFWKGMSGTAVRRYPWIGGPSDANGVFFLAADAKRLYVRAEIKDAAPQLRPFDMDPADAWNGTSLQVFFGTRLNRHAEYEDGDFSLAFWVAQEKPSNNLKLMVAKGRLLSERQYQSSVVEWKKDSYIIEASFSLDMLGIAKPFRDGQKVRCEFRINHAKMGEDRSVIVNWRTSTDDAWRNPTTWSEGIVVKKP
jgi:hypothetical protein